MFDGRPTPGPGEPLWTEEDRRDAVALAMEEQGSCPGCKGQIEETTDPENQFRYVAEGIRCHRCAAQRHELDDHAKNGDPAGILVTASLKT